MMFILLGRPIMNFFINFNPFLSNRFDEKEITQPVNDLSEDYLVENKNSNQKRNKYGLSDFYSNPLAEPAVNLRQRTNLANPK